MRRFTYFPWDIYSWKLAFRLSGTAGVAMMTLLLADILQITDPSTGASVHQSAASILLVRAPLTFLAALIWLSRPTFAGVNIRDLRFWFLIYAGWYALSLGWSTFPAITAGKALELGIAIFIILQAGRDQFALQRLEGIYRLCLLIGSFFSFITILGYFAGFQIFIHPGGHALFTSSSAESPFMSGNGLGYMSMSLLLVAYAEWTLAGIKSIQVKGQVLYSMFIFMFASSRTSMGILVLGILLIASRKSKVLVSLYAITGVTAAYLFKDQILKSAEMGQTQGNFDTLSGRTVMWLSAFHQWTHRPIMGFGGGAGGKYVLSRIGIPSLAAMSTLHSGIMECLTGLGLVGLLLALYMLVGASLRVMHLWKKHPELSGLFIWILIFWITSIMSVGVMGWMDVEVAVYLVVLSYVDILRKQERIEHSRHVMPRVGAFNPVREIGMGAQAADV